MRCGEVRGRACRRGCCAIFAGYNDGVRGRKDRSRERKAKIEREADSDQDIKLLPSNPHNDDDHDDDEELRILIGYSTL